MLLSQEAHICCLEAYFVALLYSELPTLPTKILVGQKKREYIQPCGIFGLNSCIKFALIKRTSCECPEIFPLIEFSAEKCHFQVCPTKSDAVE